jgi:hypothetical protein
MAPSTLAEIHRNFLRKFFHGSCRFYLVGKPEGRIPLGRPRRRWEIILRWIFRKWEGVVGTG